jgi:hypothetical protein
MHGRSSGRPRRPPTHNFELLPPIRSARPLWDLKHPRIGQPRPAVEPAGGRNVVSPSVWPLVVAIGLGLVFVALLLSSVWACIGGQLSPAGIVGWTWREHHEAAA